MSVKMTKKECIILGCIFIIFGVILIVIGINNQLKQIRIMKNVVATNATIVEIAKNDNEKAHVHVSFEVDGKIYTGSLDDYEEIMRVGDYVEIYYNAENPSEFVGVNGSSKESILAGFVMGIIFILCGIALLATSGDAEKLFADR